MVTTAKDSVQIRTEHLCVIFSLIPNICIFSYLYELNEYFIIFMCHF